MVLYIVICQPQNKESWFRKKTVVEYLSTCFGTAAVISALSVKIKVDLEERYIHHATFTGEIHLDCSGGISTHH